MGECLCVRVCVYVCGCVGVRGVCMLGKGFHCTVVMFDLLGSQKFKPNYGAQIKLDRPMCLCINELLGLMLLPIFSTDN